jgi:ABC-type sugar transport system ATPase subunit
VKPVPAAEPNGPGAVVLEARGIRKTYGHVEALRGVDLQLHAGEIVALMGDNGAGKSTLAGILCGARAADEGEVLVAGEAIGSLRHAQQLGVGMVFQDLALAPDLSVADNMFLGRERFAAGMLGRFKWLDRGRMRAEALAAVQELGGTLTSVSVDVDALSGGQRQVAAVARTLMTARLAVLMDEPTAALGPRQVAVVTDAIRSAARAGLGVMVISHDVPAVLELADRVIVMRQGRIVADAAATTRTLADVVTAMVGEHHMPARGAA